MLDNFGGAAAWDRYCSVQDEMLEYDMENTQCKNCMGFDSDKCKCLKRGEKVDPEEYAITYDCEWVEPR